MFINRKQLASIKPCLECDGIPKVGMLTNKKYALESFIIECRNGCTGECQDVSVEKTIALWNKYWEKKEELWARKYYKTDWLRFEDLKDE